MIVDILERTIINRIIESQSAPTQCIDIYDAPEDGLTTNGNDLLFFLKPELTQVSDPQSLHAILDLVFQTLDHFNTSVQSIKLLGADYLRQTGFMAAHYGAMNAIATDPATHVGDDARVRFKEVYGRAFSDANIIGAFPWLAGQEKHTSTDLYRLWQEAAQGPARHKIGPGTHCAHMPDLGDDLYIFNGGFPALMDHYNLSGRSILAMHIVSASDFSTLRTKMLGSTNPAKAETGSLRYELLSRATEFGLKTVNDVWNGFHLSAGPVEATIELTRYYHGTGFSEANLSKTAFGARLLDAFGSQAAMDIVTDCVRLPDNQKISTYDLTEGHAPECALRALRAAMPATP